MHTTYHCVCVAAPQVLDAMSDSTNTSTTANDLDLLYLKGIMESPVVRCTTYILNICGLTFDAVNKQSVCLLACVRSKRRV